MGTLAEVSNAVEVIRAAGDPPLALLHCVSDYPTAPEDANLRAMETLHAQFEVPVGWSDHTTGIDVSLAAVALGASIIEKHFTLDKTLAGPDHAASLDPTELGSLIAGIRRVEAALGDGTKAPKASESACAASSRRSLVPVRDLEVDEVLSADDLVAKRPGTGIPPSALTEVVGLRLRRSVPVDTPLTWDHIEATGHPISSSIPTASAPAAACPPSATP